MPLDLRRIHSRVWRAIYFDWMFLIFSYVFSDLIVSDTSIFPKLLNPTEGVIIEAEASSDARPHVRKSTVPWENISLVLPQSARQYSWVRRIGVLRFSSLDSARSHGYRVGLPRGDTVPD